MKTKRYRVDVWKWSGKSAEIEILALPNARLTHLWMEETDDRAFPCAGFGLDEEAAIPILKWTGDGDPPSRVTVTVTVTSMDPQGGKLLPLVGALAPYILGGLAAILGVVATNLRYDLDAYNSIVSSRSECKDAPSKPICLSKQLALMNEDKKELEDYKQKLKSGEARLSIEKHKKSIIDGEYLEQREDIKRYSNQVAYACPVDDSMQCLKFVIDRFERLVVKSGCDPDNKKSALECIQRVTAAVR